MATSLWYIRLLGGLALEREGQVPVTRFRSRKTAALLSYLALFPRPHTREALTELFWPDVPLEQGQQSLRSALSSLRRQLEPPGIRPGSVVEAGRLRVSLNRAAFTTDVAAFTTAVRRGETALARSLYTGPLLPECYEDWALLEAERLQTLYEGLVRTESQPAPEPSRTEPAAQVAEDVRVSVPVVLDRFFGREQELGALLALREEAGGLTTLLGGGGSGKTRLAIEAARRWPGTVWFVSLAECRAPEELPEAIAAAMKRVAGRDSALERVGQALREAPGCLLVLDNLEQLVGAALSPILASLRRAAPLARILATSRQRLVVPGEQLIAVAALPAPVLPPGEEIVIEELGPLARNPSVALYIDRAQACRPDFQITPKNAASLVALVTLLEGMPLALELAASWVGVFTPRQMYEHLVDTPGTLEARMPLAERASVGRHRSLFAVAAWSYGLLSSELRALFRQLSAFVGGASLTAIRAICPMASEEGIVRLMERSLVRGLTDEETEPLFTLPEALREFALDRCSTEDELEPLRARHADYYLRWLTEQPQEQGAVMRALPNLLVAYRWAQEHAQKTTQVAFVRVLWRCLYHAGAWEQGLRLLAEGRAVAEELGADQALADFGMAGATFAFLRADYPEARRAKELAATHYTRIGDIGRAAKARADVGAIALVEGDLDFGIAVIEREIGLLRPLEALRVPYLETLQNLGIAYLRRRADGDLARARECILEALHHAEELGVEGTIAYCRMALGDVALTAGNLEDAERHYAAAADGLRHDRMDHRLVEALMRQAMCLLQQSRPTDAHPVVLEYTEGALRLGLREMLVTALEATADLLFRSEIEPEAAARLWGAAETARKTLPLVPPPALLEFVERMSTLAQLSAPRALRAGRKLTIEQAAQEARAVLLRVPVARSVP